MCHGIHVKVRGQFVGFVYFFCDVLLPVTKCRFSSMASILSTEPSHQPLNSKTYLLKMFIYLFLFSE